MMSEFLMRTAFQAISTALGSTGILCLYASFVNPRLAVYAILCLSTATAMTLALPKSA